MEKKLHSVLRNIDKDSELDIEEKEEQEWDSEMRAKDRRISELEKELEGLKKEADKQSVRLGDGPT